MQQGTFVFSVYLDSETKLVVPTKLADQHSAPAALFNKSVTYHHSNGKSNPTSCQVARACCKSAAHTICFCMIRVPGQTGMGSKPVYSGPEGKSDLCAHGADCTSDQCQSHCSSLASTVQSLAIPRHCGLTLPRKVQRTHEQTSNQFPQHLKFLTKPRERNSVYRLVLRLTKTRSPAQAA